jgi:lysophospholipase L1-like esterase
MGLITDRFATAWRDYVTENVPASGAFEPVKSEIRALGPLIETAVSTAGLGALVDVVYATRAELDADLAHDAGTTGLVYADPDDANNDLYVKAGASGAGAWTLTTALHGIVAGLAQPYVDEMQAIFDEAEPLLPIQIADEVGIVLRLRWAARELASFTKNLGWRFQRLLLLADDTRMDDHPAVLVQERVLTPTGPETGAFWRLIFGNRLFADASVLYGFYPRRMTIPASAHVDDDMAVSLGDRLSGVVNGGFSGPDICCSGDSLTAGTGGTPYPAALQALLGIGAVVRNLGVGGETSATIAGRMGAGPFLATVAGGQIPAAGAVDVTLTGYDGAAVNPLQQGDAGINPCTLAGIAGTLSYSGAAFHFTRSAGGVIVDVPTPLPLVTEAYRDRGGDIQLMWWGQNDGVNDAADIIYRQRHLIDWQTRPVPRWLVFGLSTSTAAFRAPMETQFLEAYGRRFLNVREYLASDEAMDRAGLVPTGTDLGQMAAGQVPDSLRSDPTHLNTAGYAQVAFFAHRRMQELGWL